MSKPMFRRLGSRYEFYWQQEHIHAMVNRVIEHQDGRIVAEIHFQTDMEHIPPHITHTQLNLLSSKSKSSLAKDLEEILPLHDQWPIIVEQLSAMVLEAYRVGEPLKEIWPLEDCEIPEPKFLIKPLVYKDKPNMFFGEGGTAKSTLAMAIALMTQVPECASCINVTAKPAKVGYLDYETDEEDFTLRLTKLEKGLGIMPVSIFYRQCSIPFIEDVNQIENIIADNGIDFIIIDSLGVACANGNLNDALTATAFFSALRRLKATSLLITHTRKDDGTRKPDAYGSVYYTNLARSIFQVVKQDTSSPNQINVALYHTKNNQGPLLFPPKGISINFDSDKTWLQNLDACTVPEFMERLTLKARIISWLKANAKGTVSDIADGLDAPQDSVRRILNRYKEDFVKIGDEWALKFRI